MSDPNPYRSPDLPAEAQALPPGLLTVGRALRFVLLTMVLFAGLGALLGATIAIVMPQYYKQLFGLVTQREAMLAGVLLGTMQGGGAGIAVGVLLSAIVGWLQTRAQVVAAMRHK